MPRALRCLVPIPIALRRTWCETARLPSKPLEFPRMPFLKLSKKSLSGASSADISGTPQQNEPLLPRFGGF